MRAYEFLQPINENQDAEVDEWKASPQQCRSTKKLGASADSSCKAQGLRARTSSHTTGQGTPGKKGTGVHVKGRKMKSVKYGGPVKDYS